MARSTSPPAGTGFDGANVRTETTESTPAAHAVDIKQSMIITIAVIIFMTGHIITVYFDSQKKD
jgi:hypothetical protein